MNLENKQISMNAAATNGQRVSVIAWCGKESTMISKEEPSLNESSALFDVEKKPAVASNQYQVTKFRCAFCGKSFKWNSHWQSHVRTHTGEKPFVCEACGKRFARSDGLQCHELTHMSKNTSYSHQSAEGSGYVNANPCIYPSTGESVVKFSNKDALTRKHEQAKLFNCQYCDRIFYSSSGMVKHMQVHKGVKKYDCELCDGVFTKKSALEVHKRVHTGVKPYRCNVCSKAFSISGNLKRHLLIHTGERPYKCGECPKTFNNPSHLTRHLKQKHGNGVHALKK